MKKSSSISEALRIAKQVKRKRYALGGANYGQEAYNQLLRDLEARKKLPLPAIAPLAGPSQSNTQTPNTPGTPATPSDKTPDVPAGDTTNIRRPIEGGGGGDNFAPVYQNMPTGVAPSLPSSMPETIDLTTGQPQSGKTGFGPLDRAMANPGTTAANFAAGFIPVVGPINTISGLFGGPTIGSMGRSALESLSKDSQPTGAIPSNVQNLASDEVDGGGDSPTGSSRGTTTEGLHDRAMAQYAASKGHTLGQDPNADRLAMAAMMYGETRGKGDALPAGMSAINRSLATGQPIGAVIGKPNQYEGYSPASLQAVTNPASIKNPIERAAAMASLQKATDLMTGKAETTHGKGTSYGNVTSFNKASPAYNYNTPSQGAVRGSAVVGEPHTFYTVNNLAGPLAKAQARMEQAARAKAEQEQQAQIAQQGIGPGTGTPGGTGSAATPTTSAGYGSSQVASNDPGIGLGGPPAAPEAPSAPAGPPSEISDNDGAVASSIGAGPAPTGDVTGAPSAPGASPSALGSSPTPGSSPTEPTGISLSTVDPASMSPEMAAALKAAENQTDDEDGGDDSDSDSDDGDSDSNANNDTSSENSNSGFGDGSIGGESYGGGWGGSETSNDSSSSNSDNSSSDSSSSDGPSGNDGGGGGGDGGGGGGGGDGGGGEKRGGFVRAKMPKENPMVKKALKIARSREAKTKKPTGRSIVDKALVLTSKSANRQRGRP